MSPGGFQINKISRNKEAAAYHLGYVVLKNGELYENVLYQFYETACHRANEVNGIVSNFPVCYEAGLINFGPANSCAGQVRSAPASPFVRPFQKAEEGDVASTADNPPAGNEKFALLCAGGKDGATQTDSVSPPPNGRGDAPFYNNEAGGRHLEEKPRQSP